MKNISPLYKFSLKGGGWDEQRQPKMQPSAEIVRVECAKCRRECDLSHARAALCGDRARRVREMQARVRFVPCPRNPRVECAKCRRVSAMCPMPAQPSAEIVRVERDLSGAHATLCGDRACRVREMQARVRFVRCGDRVRRVREMQARVRFVRCARNPLRRSCVSSALCSTTLVRGAICGAGS